MIPASNFILVGLMGAGKTTIGRVLARNRGLRFVDSDHEIVVRCGVSIPTIFEFEGEAGFRRRESAVIDDLTQESGVVLATGGGAVLDPVSRALMHARGTVIYLRASPNELYLRTRHDRNRPLLQTEDPLGKMKLLYEARHPLYLETADLVLDTGRQSVHCLATRLEQLLNDAGVPSPETPHELPAECAEPPPADANGDDQGE